MKATSINTGTVIVNGVECALSHSFIQVGSPESRYGATQYHEIAYFNREWVIFQSHLDNDCAATLFVLLNSRKVTIDTRIRVEFLDSEGHDTFVLDHHLT